MSAAMSFVSYNEQRNSMAVSKSSSEISDDAALFPSSDNPLNLSMFSFNEANAAFLPHPNRSLLESQPVSGKLVKPHGLLLTALVQICELG